MFGHSFTKGGTRKDIYVDLEGYTSIGTLEYYHSAATTQQKDSANIRRIVNTSTKVMQDKE